MAPRYRVRKLKFRPQTRTRGWEWLEQRLMLWSGVIPNGTVWDSSQVQQITGNVDIAAGSTLTIKPGTIVKFDNGTNMTVDGTLNAQGTAGEQIYFTSIVDDSVGGDTDSDGGKNAPVRGQWGQVLFTSASTADVLDNVVVRYGGGNVDAEVEADGASPKISNSVFSNSPGFGLRLKGSAATLIGDTFQNNDVPDQGFGTGGAIHIDAASQPTIQGATFSNNFTNGVWVDGGNLAAGTTNWDNPSAVYYLRNTVTVPTGSTLTIGAGQVIKLQQSLIVNGTLMAQGTAAQPVIFTSREDDAAGGDTNNDGSATSPARGQWNQLLFTSTSTGDMLDNVVARYGGGNVNAEVEADGTSPTITNSVLGDSPNFGLRLTSSAATLTGDTFENNDVPDQGFGSGGAIEIDADSQPAIGSATFTNNHLNGVWDDGGTLPSGTINWNNTDTVYYLAQSITVPHGSTLAIAAGQVIKLAQSIIVQGTMTAIGTVAAPVIFTSLQDDSAGGDTNNDGSASQPSPTDWHSLEFTSTSTGCVLTHVEARYGSDSADGTFGMINVTGASLAVSDSVIRDSGHLGIFANSGSTLTLTDSLVVNNLYNGVQAEATATLTVVNCTIDGNALGVVLDSPTAVLTNDLITNSTGDDNSAGVGVDETGPTDLTMTYCDVYNPGANNYTGLADQTNTNGNISANPNYFNRPGGQYELRPGSPAEDAGTSAGAPATDFLGNPRYKDPNIPSRGDGSGYDIGAIEVEQTATSNVDLAATAVSGPATGLEGQSVTVNWTVAEVGAGTATGSWHDAVYLSASPVFTPDAILLGEVQHTGDLGDGSSYSASGTFTLPGVVPGNYYFLVRANSRNEVFEGTALANNVIASTATVAMDLPALTLGTPVTGQVATNGAEQLYKVTMPAGSNLDLILAGAAGDTDQLFVSFGDVPTTQSFLARGDRPNSANQSISLGNSQAGTYYVLVFAANVPSGGKFTLTAGAVGFSLSGVTPTQGSNTGQVTISISGAQFDGKSQPHLVDSAGVTIKPLAVYYTDPGLISATFDLTGLPIGPANVQVVNTGGVTQSLPDAFNIISGQPGRLETNLVVPSSVRSGRSFTVIIDYSNAGDADLLAPVLQITSTGPAQLSFTSDFAYQANSLNLVATMATGPAGIIPPGGQGEITLYATTTSAGQCNFQLSVGTYGNGTIDWSAIGPSVRPESATDAQWAALFPQLQAGIGNSWSQYQQDIAADATLLPPQLGTNDSLNDDFKIEFNKALAQIYPTVSGQLFLGDANHPLGNVPITLLDPATGDSFSTVSLNDGTFVAPGAGQGSYEITLDGFVPTSTAPLVVGASGLTGVQIIAEPGGSISGSLALSPDGSPLPGELVTAVNQDGQSFAATTGADGKYTIDSLPAGVYQVSAGGDSYALGSLSGTKVQTGQLSPDVDLALTPASTIEGTVSGPGGPIAGALVTAIGADGTSMAATTSATGAYAIGGLPGQTYTLDVQASGFVEQQFAGIVLPTNAIGTGANVTLSAAGSVSGTLTSAGNGAPVTGATVELTSTAGSYNAVSDSNGKVDLAGVAPGVYTVTAPAAGGFMTATTQATVTAGATATFAFALAPLGKVTGTVTNSVNGKPVPDVTVYAVDSAGFVSSTTTDANGKYELDNFDAGSYQVVLGDELTPGLAQSDVTFDATHQSATANFTIALAGSIAGTVFQSDGATPVTGALVALVQNGQVLLSMKTDQTGNYVFDLVLPGTYQVEVDSAGLDFPVLPGLVVGGGNSLTSRNLSAGTDTIHGVVTDASSGKPLAGAAVTLSRADAGVAFTDAGDVVTAADGSFSVTGLVPGSYTVVASAAGYATTFKTVALTHGTPASASLALAAGSTVQGIVHDSQTGAPVSGAILTIAAATGTSSTAQTDANGNYVLSELAPGVYTLGILADGYETLIVGQVSVGQGSQLLDESLDPSAITVSGIVQNGSQPLSQVEVVAKDQNGFLLGLATTAADGTFTLTSLPPGTITITASASGYQSSSPATTTVHQGDSVSNVSLTMAPVGVSDVTITPVLQSTINDITSNKPGLVVELKKTRLAPGYTLTDAEQALLTGTVPKDCIPLQQNANELVAMIKHDVTDLSGTPGPPVVNEQGTYINAVNGFIGSQQPLARGISSVEHSIKLLNLAINDALPLNPDFQKFYDKFSEYLPSHSDLASVEATTIIAAGDVFGVDLLKNSATATDLNTAENLLNNLLHPGENATSPLLNLQSDAAFIDAFFYVATGGSATDAVVQFLNPGQTVELALVLADLKALNTKDPKRGQELAAIAANIKGNADYLFGFVSTIKNLIVQEKAQIDAMKAYVATILDADNRIDALQSTLLALDCCVTAHTPAPKTSGNGGQNLAPQVADLAGEPVGGVCVLCGCTGVDPPGNDPVNGGTTNAGGALDPNNLVGPAGHGSQGFIQPGTFGYEVDFENDPTQATAAAQIVTATLNLNGNLDPSTFQFTGFGFGPYTFSVPPGLTHYQTTIDLRPDGFELLVPVTMDLSQGVVTVEFQSLDPATMQPPDGINDGFLPIDDANHDGEGYFTFTVQPKAGLPSGTTISEQASIVFDTNAAISTPTATNTLDVGAPTSTVAALPAQSPASFTVSWSGSDDASGSGIAFYDVFVSDNGGPFTAFQTATTATSATFTGAVGHTYAFYSVATDNVGHRQPTPTAAQATTTVVAAPFSLTEDIYVIGSGTISVSAASGVLQNDTGPSQLTVTSGSVVGAEGGTFVFSADGSFTYTPPANFPGFDYAKYTAQDASGDQGTATVNVLSQTGGVVWKFYEQVLHRDPEYAGLQGWINDFLNGGKPGDIAAGFFESTELLNQIITGYYQQYLGRGPQGNDLSGWESVFRQTGGPEGIKAGFAASPEFNALAGNPTGSNPAGWLTALYGRILNRAPLPGDLPFWEQQLASGVSEYQVALDFFTSLEAFDNDVTGWFYEYLGRTPTIGSGGEQPFFAQQMMAGASDKVIEQAITNSPEYGANPPASPPGAGERLPNYLPANNAAKIQASLAATDAVFGKLS